MMKIWRESTRADLKTYTVNNLNIDAFFADIGVMRVKILTFFSSSRATNKYKKYLGQRCFRLNVQASQKCLLTFTMQHHGNDT